MIIDFTMAKIERICTAENNVRERLSRVFEHMDISAGERAVALNTAIWRVRCGGQAKTAEREALQYARGREMARARVRLWDEPDGAA